MKPTYFALPQVDGNLCTLCGLCVEACPCGAVTLGETGPMFTCPKDICEDSVCAEGAEGCCFYLCEEVCPTRAITCAFEIVMEDRPHRPDRFLKTCQVCHTMTEDKGVR
jgi:formate hydrogenlyase subunit 6/NADH:ubiquinone oxidoreductase subunit I